MEHVYGILLDEKFLHKSVHAAFVNTKWYEAWLDRTLHLDPIIYDVLSWKPSLPRNSHHARHKTHRHLLFRICVVFFFPLPQVDRQPRLRPAAHVLMRFSTVSQPILSRRRGESLLESVFITHFACVSFLVCRVTPLLVFARFFVCHSKQFVHASAITADKHRNLSTPPSSRSTAAAAVQASLAWLLDRTASFVTSACREASWDPHVDGARQVRLACAKPQTSREVDQDPEGGLTRQCNARPSFFASCVFVLPFVPSPITSPSAADSFYLLLTYTAPSPAIVHVAPTPAVAFI